MELFLLRSLSWRRRGGCDARSIRSVLTCFKMCPFGLRNMTHLSVDFLPLACLGPELKHIYDYLLARVIANLEMHTFVLFYFVRHVTQDNANVPRKGCYCTYIRPKTNPFLRKRAYFALKITFYPTFCDFFEKGKATRRPALNRSLRLVSRKPDFSRSLDRLIIFLVG